MVQNQRLHSEIYPTLIHLKPYNVILGDNSSWQGIGEFASSHYLQRITSSVLLDYYVIVHNKR